MDYSIINAFTKAITNTTTPTNEITAYFTNGQKAIYTYNILEMLKTEKDITTIVDNTTGEIIYEKEVK